ncbi:MAG TPA: hypothetical protein VGD58_29750 [Herpetosiphonaceae bacterium]
MPDLIAAGHVFDPARHTGIRWEPHIAQLFRRSVAGTAELIAEASHATTSAWEFWHTFAFAQVFPQVDAWWFGSAWTRQVRISRPVQTSGDGRSVTGWMQFVDETPSQYWTIIEGTPVTVDVPYPPHEVQLINLPLRITLGWLTGATLTGNVAPVQWQMATSLVARRDLEVVFPTTYAAFETNYGHWQLAGLDLPMRDALCTLQGLRRP